MKHSDFITHINNDEDEVYLRSTHFPVNMRLFETSEDYKNIILQQCEYIRKCCLTEKEGYKKPHGMSSANLGLAHNIIGITMNRNKTNEYCLIMINPFILDKMGNEVMASSNCGSLTLDEPIKVKRWEKVFVEYYNENGQLIRDVFHRHEGAFTIQHEVDHNNGILITDTKFDDKSNSNSSISKIQRISDGKLFVCYYRNGLVTREKCDAWFINLTGNDEELHLFKIDQKFKVLEVV